MEQFQEAALVILVPEAFPFVHSLRKEYDPAAEGSIPAHITINYPFLPNTQGDEALFQRLTKLFSSLETFDFELNEIGKFPGVLYIKPTPEDPFRFLVNAVANEFPESPPYGGKHKELIPHLTVAHSEFIDNYPQVENDIEMKLENILPISSTATEVSHLVYQNSAWEEISSYKLGTR